MAYGDDRSSVASDTFDSSISASWANGEGDYSALTWQTGGHIRSNTSFGDGNIRRNSETFDDDQYSSITVQTDSGAAAIYGPTVRHTGGTDESCYFGAIDNFADDRYEILEHSNGIGVTLLANSAASGEIPMSSGDVVTIEAEGTTLRLGSDASGSDAQKVTTTDATLTGGDPGIYMLAQTASELEVTAWDGGDIGAAPVTTTAGDYVVRRNASNTDEIPDAGSDLLLLWDTAVSNVGSGITYSSGVFTLNATGHYLVLCSDQWGTTDTTGNERTNVQMELTLGSTVLSPVGYSTGYIRRASGSQEFINFSAAVIEVSSTTGNADELQVRVERIDNSTAGTVNRIADRSGITIIKLDDTWGYGRYQSSAAFTPSATDNVRNTADIGTTDEQDSPFTRTGNAVDIATTNPVLAVYSFQNDDSDSVSGRTEMQGVIDLQGTEVAGTWSQTYGPRATDNCDWGGMSSVFLLEPSSGDDVTLKLVGREDIDEDWFAALQLVELPSGTEAAIVEATTGDFNTAATNFTWDTAPRVDTAAFTHSAGNANIDVDNAGDYLAMVSLAQTTDAGGSGARSVPAVQFRVNTTDDETAGSSSYGRGSGTADHNGIATATLLTGLSANDSIYARCDRIGTVTTTNTNTSGGMAVVRLSSLFPAGGDATANITGDAADATAGSVTPQTGVSETITGASADAEAGTSVASVSTTESITGASAPAQAGNVTGSAGVGQSVTGAEVSAITGDVSVVGDVNQSLTGGQTQTEAGGVTAGVVAVVQLSGASVAGESGDVAAESGVAQVLSGFAAAAEAGTTSVEIDVSVPLSGDSAPALAGTVTSEAAGSATATPVGAQTSAAAGTVTAVGITVGPGPLGRFSPLSLHQRAYGTFSRDLTVTIGSARANAESGAPIPGSTRIAKSISPLLLASPARAFTAKSLGSATATITGASLQFQAEELEGANCTIYLDGAEVLFAATETGAQIIAPPKPVYRVFFDLATNDVVFTPTLHGIAFEPVTHVLAIDGKVLTTMIDGASNDTTIEGRSGETLMQIGG